ncbi:hypothetical protein TNCV_185561 [Trichonephila clavipes]|nr:hypothetical protein TNCV_185561 [Trichonephila clavipes]
MCSDNGFLLSVDNCSCNICYALHDTGLPPLPGHIVNRPISSNFLVSERIIASHYSATRGLLATHIDILSHGQVTRTTPELELTSPNFHTKVRMFEPPHA